MMKKTVFSILFSMALSLACTEANCNEKMQIVFVEPDVSKNMTTLNWNLPELKSWRRLPIERVNNDHDGKFSLTVKLLNMPQDLIGEVPRIKICPIPQDPNRCWEQEVLTPINKDGIFKSYVYFRLSNWDKHIFKIKIGSEKYDIVIDEDKF